MQRQRRVFVSGLIMVAVLTMLLPNAVEAQEVLAPTDNIRRALVVGVGTTQTLNLYIQYNMHRGTNQQSEPGIQGVTIVLQNPNPDIGNGGVCTQTIQALVNTIPGLNTLSLGITSEENGENKKLLINGVIQEPPLGDCFDETKRVVYLIKGEVTSLEPNYPTSAAAIGLERIGGIMIYDVTDPSGATAASGEVGLFNGNNWFLDSDGEGL